MALCLWRGTVPAARWAGLATAGKIRPLDSQGQEDVVPLSKLPSDLAGLAEPGLGQHEERCEMIRRHQAPLEIRADDEDLGPGWMRQR